MKTRDSAEFEPTTYCMEHQRTIHVTRASPLRSQEPTSGSLWSEWRVQAEQLRSLKSQLENNQTNIDFLQKTDLLLVGLYAVGGELLQVHDFGLPHSCASYSRLGQGFTSYDVASHGEVLTMLYIMSAIY